MSNLGRISRVNVKHAFNRDLLLIVINALVFSKLIYCSSVWSSTSGKNIAKLLLVQNFAACIMTETRKSDHITPALKELRWLPVKQRLHFRDAVLTFKCITGCAPHFLSNHFKTGIEVSQRTTWNSRLLNIPF